MVATELLQEGLLQGLQVHGVDVAAAIEQRRYIPLDVAETLSTFMVMNLPDPVRFFKIGGDLITAAARAAKGGHPPGAAGSRLSPVLWAQNKTDAAIQLEHFWDEIAKTYEVDILRGYVLTGLQREQQGYIYERICAEHSAVRSQNGP